MGAIARRAIIRPAKKARAVPPRTPMSRNSRTLEIVVSMSEIGRAYWMITGKLASRPVRRSRTWKVFSRPAMR